MCKLGKNNIVLIIDPNFRILGECYKVWRKSQILNSWRSFLLMRVPKCISNARIIQIMCSIGVKICTTTTGRRGAQSLWNDNLILHFHGWMLGHELAGNVLD